MFQLKRDRTFSWPVDVEVPADGGAFAKQRFTARFKEVSGDRLVELAKARPGEGDVHILREVVVGWGEDVQDEDGSPLPFSEETLGRMIAVPYVRLALLRTYAEAIGGLLEKNWPTRPVVGPRATGPNGSATTSPTT
jgi:hypothetical protein